MASSRERIGGWLNTIESRWSLWTLISASGLVASFSIPAWAVRSAQIFSDYAPLSWVAAGFVGVFAWAVIRLIWQWANKIRVKAYYDARMLEKRSIINPLDLTFERKRIILDDFVLPSFTLIDGKTFIDCDLIGPANIYFHSSNQAQPIRSPKIDAVWLAPTATFNNGFIFNNFIFRNCSFQRISMFASIENYHQWKDHPMINWISISPTEDDIVLRQATIKSAASAGQTDREIQDKTTEVPASTMQGDK